eukprot:scaffold67753_cov66-Cyclotella_meneghiniana.AAC.8
MLDPIITSVYGPTANLYTILSVPPTASTVQIREAYFCLRYEIYQTLQQSDDVNNNNAVSNNNNSSSPNRQRVVLTKEERKATEDRMEAITATFRILTDAARRVEYDASLLHQASSCGCNTNNKNDVGGGRNNKNNNNSVFQRRKKLSMLHERGRPQAETVTGFRKKNIEKNHPTTEEKGGGEEPQQDANDSYDSIFAEPADNPNDSMFTTAQASSNFSSVFPDEANNTPNTNNAAILFPEFTNQDAITESSNNTSNFPYYEEHLPLNVDKLNTREQMLYKNQMYLYSQQHNDSKYNNGNEKSRIGRRYEGEERGDWLAGEDVEEREEGGGGDQEQVMMAGEEEEQQDENDQQKSYGKKKSRWNLLRNNKNKLSSPTGVDEFPDTSSSPSPTKKNLIVSSASPKHKSKRRLSLTKRSKFSFDDASSKVSAQDDTYDDETRVTHDDDTRTYDDETATQYDDDTTQYDDMTAGDTLEDTTVGESTYASYDDETTYAGESEKKYSPSHKKGHIRPEPILRSGGSSSRLVADKDGDHRRVIVHSHRGRKSRGDDKDFTSTMCPFPSLTEVKEEVRGTWKDTSSAFHQVLHAFVISPDDIDRLSDKIRDAQVELTESYHRQLKERQRSDNVVTGVAGKKKKKKDRELSL